MTLEHLVLALTQDLKTREILSACGANVERLRQRLETFLAERLLSARHADLAWKALPERRSSRQDRSRGCRACVPMPP
jgi:hypothetical protein